MDILNNKNLINYINYVKSLDYINRQLYLLQHPDWITNKILMDYYYNDVILQDKELLWLIESHRVGNIPRSGLVDLDVEEVSYLMKAWKSQQYHRFMCHILSRYSDRSGKYTINPVNNGNYECCVCWRPLHGIYDGIDNNDVAYTSQDTGTCICKSCLYQLFMFSQLMDLLGDKDFYSLVNR